MGAINDLRYFRQRSPLCSKRFQLGFDLVRSERNEMSQPIIGSGAVTFTRRVVEFFCSGIDTIARNALECVWKKFCQRQPAGREDRHVELVLHVPNRAN